jgi:hypothetical protein
MLPRIYDLSPGPTHAPVSIQRRLTAFVLTLAWFILVMWGTNHLFFQSSLGYASVFVFAFFMAVAAAIRPFRFLEPPRIELEIGDDYIERRITGTYTQRKRIARAKVRSITEIDFRGAKRLAVKNHGWFGSFMLGYITVPSTIPEYEDIKTHLLQWQPG